MTVRVAIDGVITTAEEATISVFDRGFLYGDSVFEAMRTYGGARCFGERAHLERLARSAECVGIAMPVSLDALAAELRETLRAAANTESYVRIVVTRGQGPLSLDPTLARDPRRVIIVSPLPPPSTALYARGLRVASIQSTRPAEHTRAAGAKASNYLANLLANEAARARGADEALLVDPSGEVLEGATSNVFVVHDGVLSTPPLSLGILGGITRAQVLRTAARLGVPTAERPIFPSELYRADEIFLTSSIREIAPVVAVDGQTIADGAPGRLTQRLHAAYKDDVRAS